MTLPDLLSPAALPALVCRPALPMDAAGVMDVVRNIWNGHDYIPYVWNDWLADPHGLMAVAELGGRIVGLGKATRLGAGDWWLEGMRVHPECEGRGFARHIFNYLLAYWETQGGVVRLMTHCKNFKIHHLCEQSGFARIGALAYASAPALAEPVKELSPLRAAELADALDLAQDTPPLAYGLVDYGWKWGQASFPWLEEALHRERFWGWRTGAGWLTTWEDEEEGEKQLLLQGAVCPPQDVEDYLLDFRRLAAHLGYPRAYWMAPLRPELAPTLETAGFSADLDEATFLYEKKSLTA